MPLNATPSAKASNLKFNPTIEQIIDYTKRAHGLTIWEHVYFVRLCINSGRKAPKITFPQAGDSSCEYHRFVLNQPMEQPVKKLSKAQIAADNLNIKHARQLLDAAEATEYFSAAKLMITQAEALNNAAVSVQSTTPPDPALLDKQEDIVLPRKSLRERLRKDIEPLLPELNQIYSDQRSRLKDADPDNRGVPAKYVSIDPPNPSA